MKQNVPLICIDMPSSDIDRLTSYVKAFVPRQIALLQAKVLINNHLNYFGVLVLEVLVFKVLVFEILVFEVLVFEVLIFEVLVFEVLGLRSSFSGS